MIWYGIKINKTHICLASTTSLMFSWGRYRQAFPRVLGNYTQVSVPLVPVDFLHTERKRAHASTIAYGFTQVCLTVNTGQYRVSVHYYVLCLCLHDKILFSKMNHPFLNRRQLQTSDHVVRVVSGGSHQGYLKHQRRSGSCPPPRSFSFPERSLVFKQRGRIHSISIVVIARCE